jgi:Hg(II)-responsive transcriptional regulator
MKGQMMQIGEVASRAGVNIQTLRYYERRGLLPRPLRSGTSNYRLYTPDTVQQVRFVKDAQSIGFTLEEIKKLFALRAESANPCTDIRDQATSKIADIDAKIRNLHTMRQLLANLVAACPESDSDASCPTLESLDHREERNES